VSAGEGLFEVIRAEARQEDENWLLDGRLDLELSDGVIEALESGVTLTIQIQFELTRRQRFWVNAQEALLNRDFELQYMALSQRYVIREVGTGEQQNYATLYSALRNLGKVRDWPVFTDSMLADDEQYWCALRVVLNQESLPGPLQMLAFWRGDFGLESDWYRWKLR